jgi:hypothetical protein
LGAFGDSARLIRLTPNFVSVWTGEHDHGITVSMGLRSDN